MTKSVSAGVRIVVLTEWELLVVNLCISVVNLIRLVRLVNDIHVSVVMWVWQLVVMLNWLSHLMDLVLDWVMRGNWMLMLNMIV